MNSLYNFDLFIKATISGALDLPFYTGLTTLYVISCAKRNFLTLNNIDEKRVRQSDKQWYMPYETLLNKRIKMII
jgi:hypothetical protein